MITWSDKHTRSLIAQVQAGKVLTEIRIPGKTKKAILQKRRTLRNKGILDRELLTQNCLRYRHERKWTEEENQMLILAVQAGTRLSKITITDRNVRAITAQRKKLARQGRLQFSGYDRRRPWTVQEVNVLREYTIVHELGGKSIHDLHLLPGRSPNAISQQIRRLEFAHPRRSQKAKDAKLHLLDKKHQGLIDSECDVQEFHDRIDEVGIHYPGQTPGVLTDLHS